MQGQDLKQWDREYPCEVAAINADGTYDIEVNTLKSILELESTFERGFSLRSLDLECNDNSLEILQVYDDFELEWKLKKHVPAQDLYLPDGIDTGKTIDMCRLHMGQPYCITSRALYNYVNSGHEHAALEVNCKATLDRRPFRKMGGSNCWKNFGKFPAFDLFRYGTDEEWKSTGKINWM